MPCAVAQTANPKATATANEKAKNTLALLERLWNQEGLRVKVKQPKRPDLA